MVEIAQNIVGGHLLVMKCALTRCMPKSPRNIRSMVAVTSASPKVVVVASMLC